MDRETILVVHSDPSVRSELKGYLEGWGYQVSEAEDGARARERFPSGNPSLVLLPVHLPDNSGHALLTEFRASHAETPVILIAESHEMDEAIRGLSLGAYDLVEKPIRFARLQHVIQNALELRRLKSAQASAPVPGTLASLAHGIPSGGIALFEVERQLVEQALQATGWNKSKAARLLNITRDTLRYKVKKYRLEEHPTLQTNLAS